MNREECFNLVIEIHEEFHREVTLYTDYHYKRSKNDGAMINSFVSYLEKTKGLGLDFLINYFESSWNWWYDKEHLKYGLSSVMLSWHIGKKAIERYEKIRETDNKRFPRHRRKIRKEVGVRVFEKFSQRKDKNSIKDKMNFYTGIKDYEEKQKQKFYNEDLGFAWCVLSTTLFNHKSELCSNCIFKDKCKAELKDYLPQIYKLRNYE